ncbi:MAG: sulfur carrier protein ThiS [Thermoleophilaceae bacterium]
MARCPTGRPWPTPCRETGAAPDGRGVAVALGGEVVPRGQWQTMQLEEGEQVEVLHAVQGG